MAETTPKKTDNATPKKPDVNLLDDIKASVKALVQDINNLPSESDKDHAYDYIAGILTTEGYTCVITDDMDSDGPNEYNLNMLYNSKGATKRPRLDEIQDNNRQIYQGVKVTSGINTAREIAESVIGRAGIIDGPVRDDLVKILTRGLNMHIKNPVQWQNNQRKV